MRLACHLFRELERTASNASTRVHGNDFGATSSPHPSHCRRIGGRRGHVRGRDAGPRRYRARLLQVLTGPPRHWAPGWVRVAGAARAVREPTPGTAPEQRRAQAEGVSDDLPLTLDPD